MISISKILIILGSLNAFLAIALGAFGAHSLKEKLGAEMLGVWHTAVEYHFYHALGLILVAIIMRLISMSAMTMWSAGLMMMGILLFSGSLYVIALTSVPSLGIITPIGGLCFLTAWLLLAIAAIRYL